MAALVPAAIKKLRLWMKNGKEWKMKTILSKLSHLPEQEVHEGMAHLIATGKVFVSQSGLRNNRNNNCRPVGDQAPADIR